MSERGRGSGRGGSRGRGVNNSILTRRCSKLANMAATPVQNHEEDEGGIKLGSKESISVEQLDEICKQYSDMRKLFDLIILKLVPEKYYWGRKISEMRLIKLLPRKP